MYFLTTNPKFKLGTKIRVIIQGNYCGCLGKIIAIASYGDKWWYRIHFLKTHILGPEKNFAEDEINGKHNRRSNARMLAGISYDNREAYLIMERRLIDLYKNGMWISDIVKKYGIGMQRFYDILKRHKVELIPGRCGRPKKNLN